MYVAVCMHTAFDEYLYVFLKKFDCFGKKIAGADGKHDIEQLKKMHRELGLSRNFGLSINGNGRSNFFC